MNDPAHAPPSNLLRLQVGDGTLAYEVRGEGPDLVLVHGFSLDLRSWNPQMAELTKRFRVIRYDLRGFGASSTPAGAYEHGDDLKHLMQHLGCRNVLLVGLSLGGNVALSFATHHPDMLRGLVLASAGLPGYTWTSERPPETVARVAAEQGIKAAKTFWLAHDIFASVRDLPAMRTLLAQMVHDYSGWQWQGPNRQAVIAPFAVPLEDFKLPTLILSGNHDIDGYRLIAAHLASLIPNAELEEFEQGGHMLNMDSPNQFLGSILRFSSHLDSPARP